MPRSRRSAPARRAAPAAAPQRSAAPPARSTQSAQPPAPTTAAHPPAPVSQGPGLFGQMASTAAGVAVGSAVGHTIGHGLTSMFGGGGGSNSEPQAAAPAQEPVYQPPQAAPYAQQPQQSFGNAAACEVDAKAFAQCMTNNNHDVNACQWYLDMLKQCQASSAHPSSSF
ncbi:hypothetical protein H4R34_005694 [Dimargaris verticillata]|uniref:CHCH domain-containing protein n=1 Tax=Dimargaris verticillata TaxID=2761393 RepID=A0A9W8AXQ1_9FUNG|nr:hypothetical protein H4R34_005694 [Dimargaris verticillata]